MRFLSLLLSAVLATAAGADPAQRVVSIGGSITEIVYELGQQHRLIARDTTSTHPEPALDLPDVGYVRALSPEGVLSMNPGLVLAEADTGPPETLDVLREARIPLVLIPDAPTGAGILAKIRAVGAALEAETEAEALARKVAAQLDRARSRSAAIPDDARLRVLFVLSGQGGRLLAAGQGNAAAAVIEMAGATNALDGFDGFKQVSDEAIIAAAPDAILMMTRGGVVMVEDSEILTMPAIAATPAGIEGRVIRMNGQYLLGFGPRTAQAVEDLTDALYGKEPDDPGNL